MNTTTAPWGYEPDNGPEKWGDRFPLANGLHQSPIDIDSHDAVYDNWLAENDLKIKWTLNLKDVKNNGLTFVVETKDDTSTVEGGPLAKPYSLVQFHMHWGIDPQAGSEHTINGKAYAAELHFVHMNGALYDSFADAVAARNHDGLAVIAIMVEIGDEPHPAFDRLVAEISTIEYKGFKKQFTYDFDPSTFLPNDVKSYWNYPGSLTTPPCHESVQWIILKESIKVTADQLAAFRRLRKSTPNSANQERMLWNNRPLLPRNGRKVAATFLPEYFARSEQPTEERLHVAIGCGCSLLVER